MTDLSPVRQPKRHHYVPREYLRPFLGSDGRIRVYDLDNGNEFRTGVINAAVEAHFYDLEENGGYSSFGE